MALRMSRAWVSLERQAVAPKASIWLHSAGLGRLARTSSRVSGCSRCSSWTWIGLRSEPKLRIATCGRRRASAAPRRSTGTSEETSSRCGSVAISDRSPWLTRSSNWAVATVMGAGAGIERDGSRLTLRGTSRPAWYRARGGKWGRRVSPLTSPFLAARLPLRLPPSSPRRGDDRTPAFNHHVLIVLAGAETRGTEADQNFPGAEWGTPQQRDKGLRALFSLKPRGGRGAAK